MANDPDHLKDWTRQPDPPAVEPLWSFQQDGRTVTCVLRYHGPYGVEAQFLVDGELRTGRRFDNRELAVHWAERERDAWRSDGEETV